MKKPNELRKHDEMRPEYDFASMKGGVRAKYYEEYRKGTNVLLETDVDRSISHGTGGERSLAWHSQYDARRAANWRSVGSCTRASRTEA
jgi:hypothetical protein